jgi:hypothetical protein
MDNYGKKINSRFTLVHNGMMSMMMRNSISEVCCGVIVYDAWPTSSGTNGA